jgi:hypothetical protein
VQVTTLFSVLLPILIALGAVAAVVRGRDHEKPGHGAQAWRDTSLDDWRRERDAAAARERDERRAETAERLAAGRAEESEEPVKQQRIGG